MTNSARRAALTGLLLLCAACGPAEPGATATEPSGIAPKPPATADIGLAEPPAAVLSVGTQAGVVGSLGSYVFGGTGSDSPWLPGEPVTVDAGAAVRIRFDPETAVETWSVRITEAADSTGRNAAPFRAGEGPVRFDAPSNGAWTIALEARFGNRVGDAVYYWRMSIEEP